MHETRQVLYISYKVSDSVLRVLLYVFYCVNKTHFFDVIA